MSRPGEVERPKSLVGDVMLRNPRTLAAGASLAQARAALADDHVHMVLLTEGPDLIGTLVRSDLPSAATGDRPARAWSSLVGRTVPPDASASDLQRLMIERGIRRVAVVDRAGTFYGLLCLKQRRTGFCSDSDVATRSGQPDQPLLAAGPGVP